MVKKKETRSAALRHLFASILFNSGAVFDTRIKSVNITYHTLGK